jgi:hypothetical protein
MLAFVLPFGAAAQAVWVDPVQVHGPYFSSEVEIIREAVAARLRRVPGVEVVDTAAWEALATAGKTAPDGPVCAAAPRVHALVERFVTPRAVGPRAVTPLLWGDTLSFETGESVFEVKLARWDAAAWPAAIAAAEGQPGGRGGGAAGYGTVGGPMAVQVEAWSWGTAPGLQALKVLSESLAHCRDLDPQRSARRSVEQRFVVAFSAEGAPTRVEETLGLASASSRACVSERLGAWTQAPAPTPGRWVVTVIDEAPEPIARLEGVLDFDLDGPWPLEAGPLFEEPLFHRCAIPMGKTPFGLGVDEIGRVASAEVLGLDATAEACVEEALRQVTFACPGAGGAKAKGEIERR